MFLAQRQNWILFIHIKGLSSSGGYSWTETYYYIFPIEHCMAGYQCVILP